MIQFRPVHQFVFFVLVVSLGYHLTLAQTTAFTYQGKLTDTGSPANGNYDLQFKLFDALSGGVQQGATVTIPTVTVSAGIFTVTLDFGANVFSGANRFLEIGVRPAGSVNAYTVLTPRQPITSTPYAIQTLKAASADALSSACVACVQDAQINAVAGSKVTGAIPVAGVPAGSANYIQNTTTQQAASNFNINGNGTAGGTLSANLVNATTQFNLNGNRVLSITGTQNLFAGLNAGLANTTGGNNAFVGAGAGQANTVGARNAFFGFNAGRNNVGDAFGNGSDNAFFGSSAGNSNTGQQNSFFGSGAGAANTTGNFNSFFGEGAGVANTNGGFNTFIGSNANITPDSVNNTGSNNTALGFGAKIGQFTNNATAIGANAFSDHSNMIVLGSINGVNNATADTSVGIGTSTPAGKLSVLTNTGTALSASATGGGGIGIFGLSDLGTAVRATVNPNFFQGSIALRATGTSYFSGDTTPLDGNAIGDETGVVIGSSRFNGVGWLFAYNYFRNGPETLALNHNGGNVGIGTLMPARTLTVNGRAMIASIPLEASAAAVCFNAAGDLLQCGASSLRWKTNVQAFRSGLDIVRRLRPISFNWKEDGRPDIGLGAEDVAKIDSSLTLTDQNGEVAGVKYDKLNLLLINAVQQQQAEIEQLRRELRQLRARVSAHRPNPIHQATARNLRKR